MKTETRQAIADVNTRVADLSNRIEELNTRIADLNARVPELGGRLQRAEALLGVYRKQFDSEPATMQARLEAYAEKAARDSVRRTLGGGGLLVFGAGVVGGLGVAARGSG